MSITTVICFPHAGADAATYRKLANAVASQQDGYGRLRVEVISLPGRGRRYSEALLTNLDSLAEDAFQQASTWIADGGRYALFGHSMGAWLAYLTTRLIRQRGLPMPARLIVSGTRPPRLGMRKILHTLDHQTLVTELEQMGGFPPALLADAEALDYFLPILRADLEALAGHKPVQEPPLDIPITIFRGEADTVDREDALAWREESSREARLHEFVGNHFFVLDRAGEVARLTRQLLLDPAAA